MSLIEKAMRKAGLELTGDTLPKDQRTVKVFKRAIAALRAAEADVTDRLSESERELNESLRQNLAYQDRIRALEAANLQHRLKDGLGEIEGLTVSDRIRLLQLSGPAANGG